MTVYLDLVMGLNFAVDLLLILGTNRLTGFPPGFARAAAGALLGALYAGGCMLPGFSFLAGTLWRLVFLGLMGVVSYGINNSAWKRTGVFILLSMAMGGICLYAGRNDFPMLIACGCVVWLLCTVGFGSSVGAKEYVSIRITQGDTCVSVIGLKDTGNGLQDPITGEQVLVLGPDAARRLESLSPEQLREPMQTLLHSPGRGLRLIPYHALGHTGGFLIAKRYGDVKMDNKRGSAVVAFAPEVIGKGEVYQALAGGCG